MMLAYTSAAYIQVYFRLAFIHGSKQYGPRSESPLWEQSDPYSLQ